MLPRLWIVTAALLFFASCILCTNPGLKTRVTQKALDYGRMVGVTVLKEKLKEIHIPGMSGKKRVRGIGKIRYNVYGLKIFKYGLPHSAVKFSAGRGIQLSISDGYIGVHGKWKVKHRFLRLRGAFDLSVSKLSISNTIGMTRDSTGRPELHSVACSSNVGRVHFKFKRSSGWLLNLFRKFIEKPIRSTINKQICPKVSGVINALNNNLKTMKMSFRINNFAEVDYSLVNQIAITNQAMDLDFKGQFYRVGHHKQPPFQSPPISLPSQTNHMLYLGISDFLANSAGFVFYEAGALQQKITDNMIPKSSIIRLNTKSLSIIIPQLEKLYPNMKIMMKLHATRSPVLRAETNNITVEVSGALDVIVILPNSSLASLFVLNIHASLSTQINIIKMKLIGSLKLNRLKLTLGSSRIGHIPVSGLELLVSIAIKAAVLPKVNEKLAAGIPLPTVKNLIFLKTKLQVNKNILVIATDIQYHL